MAIEEGKFVNTASQYQGEQTAPQPPTENPFPEPVSGIWQNGLFTFSGTWDNTEIWGS